MAVSDSHVRPVGLRVSDDPAAIAVGMPAPRLSWRLDGSRSGVRQHAYEIELAPDPSFAAGVECSGPVSAISPVGAPWPGRPLASREVRWARVRVTTDHGLTGWSEPLRIEAALLDEAEWIARPVSPLSNVGQAEPRPVPLLRRSFVLERKPVRARLYVSALGVHDVTLNGRPVGDALFDPGWTEYRHRLLYAVHDVTDHLHEGENVLASAVGDGWWRGWLTWMARRAVYGETTALLAQLELTFADGQMQTVATDEQWRGATGGLLQADLYKGCTLDLTREPAGWRLSGFDDSGWEGVAALPLPAGLELRPMAPVREITTLRPACTLGEGGKMRVDAGQNLAGYLRLRARGPRGATITVSHAEVLEADGRLHVAALRGAEAVDRYVLADDSEDLLAPSFTFHGFRHAEIMADAGVFIDDVEVVAVASDLADTGEFFCSDERINRLFSNVRWSQRANFLALPTDCPQRDERMGWTGDIQVFAQTACANARVGAFLESWLADLALEQRADGNVTSTVPNVIHGHEFEYGGVGWGDAATLVPWAVYEAYGDRAVLERQFPSMCRWVDWCAGRLGEDGTWTGDFQLGDWLDPGAPPDIPHQATTHGDYVATAYLAHSARIVGCTAALLGEADLSARYRALGNGVAAAAWRKWRDHALTTQTGCAMAIEFGIAPEAERAAVGVALAANVERTGGRIATGFLGTPLVLPALTRTGQVEAAYRLLLNAECPGWLYPVARGATTMWERWDAIRPDGTIHAGDMSTGEGASMMSFNHYAYGAVVAWLYRSLAGIAPAAEEAGYGLVEFAPVPGGSITSARARIDTVHGPSAIAWSIAGNRLTVELEIACGSRGRFTVPPGWLLADLPPDAAAGLCSGRHRFELLRSGNLE